MKLPREVFRELFSTRKGNSPSKLRRRSRQVVLGCAALEDRVTPSGFGSAHAGAHFTAHHSNGGSSSNAALTTAQQTLRNDINTIESQSGTTVGDLANIRIAFNTLAKTDSLTPTSRSALASFEDNLVTTFTTGGAAAIDNNATLLTQFEGLFTTAPATLTTTQITDLTAAYNALTAAVDKSGITAANITTINNDYAAVLTAQGSSNTTATFPYFSLVTGSAGGGHGFGGGGCH